MPQLNRAAVEWRLRPSACPAWHPCNFSRSLQLGKKQALLPAFPVISRSEHAVKSTICGKGPQGWYQVLHGGGVNSSKQHRLRGGLRIFLLGCRSQGMLGGGR